MPTEMKTIHRFRVQWFDLNEIRQVPVVAHMLPFSISGEISAEFKVWSAFTRWTWCLPSTFLLLKYDAVWAITRRVFEAVAIMMCSISFSIPYRRFCGARSRLIRWISSQKKVQAPYADDFLLRLCLERFQQVACLWLKCLPSDRDQRRRDWVIAVC